MARVFICKACGCNEFKMINERRKCKECGKLARRNIYDIARNEFHPELGIDSKDFILTKDLAEHEIIIFDISAPRKSRKSKYKDSTSRLILFAYDEKEDEKFIGWLNNGKVIHETCEALIEEKLIPSSEGIEACISKVPGAQDEYWSMWKEEEKGEEDEEG